MPLLDTDNMINAHIFDVIVIQRVNPYSNNILKKAKKHNIKVVYESDDDFLDISHDNPSYNYILGNFDHILKLVNNSDKLVVSTNELKNRFNKLGLDNVEVIKNYYVEDALPLKPFTFRGENHLKIGYFGTLTHDNDLEFIRNVIVRVKDIFSKKGVSVIFEIAGASIDDSVDWFNVRKIPYYPMSLRTFYEWLGKNSDWDVGIIPLVDNNFNRCKSELKYIEFSALGVPVVASNINVYNEVIVDGVTGYLASNEEEWIDKLSILLEDHILRSGMVHNAHEDILKNYNLKSRVNQWDEIFKSLTK
jgi:glycosyltransferase involved in cell wall biosynthesis